MQKKKKKEKELFLQSPIYEKISKFEKFVINRSHHLLLLLYLHLKKTYFLDQSIYIYRSFIYLDDEEADEWPPLRQNWKTLASILSIT